MMKKINTFNNILSIEKNNHFVFALKENIDKDQITDNEYFISANKYSYVGIPLLIQRRFSPNIEIFNKKTNKFDIKHQNTIFALPNIQKDNQYLTPILNTNIINYYKNFELINSFSFNRTLQQLTIFYGNFIVYTNPYPKTHLTCYTLDNNKEPVWHFKVPEGFIIAPNIQIVENVIVFRAHENMGRYKNVYGLDINTGEIIWEHNLEIPYKKNLLEFTINPINNISYSYGARLYQVFDPVKGKLLLEKDMSSYFKNSFDISLVPNRLSIANNRLWFTTYSYGKLPMFGAINLKTHKLEFVQKFPQIPGILVKILYHNHKIYINDDEGHLYVFEDENSNTVTQSSPTI